MGVTKRVVSLLRGLTHLIIRGKDMATKSWLWPRDETAETIKAAQVDSAKDPKRSAPIPAMSPTLSPTLSAIVLERVKRYQMDPPRQLLYIIYVFKFQIFLNNTSN